MLARDREGGRDVARLADDALLEKYREPFEVFEKAYAPDPDG